MKTKFLILIVALSLTLSSYANHIVGGEMYYTFVSQAGNIYNYSVTIKLFRDLSSGTFLDNPINVAVYSKGSNTPFTQLVSQNSLLSLTATPGPCIINPPLVSYQVGLFTFSLSLQADGQGWYGIIKGIKQNTGTLMDGGATNIVGKVHFKKGTVLLIR